MPLQLDDLAALDAPAPDACGQPMMLPIDDIDEDPEQPRREFDADALQELSATIRDRGVRQPISVRPHPQICGRWVLNFGARRLRASKLAGLVTIPAFVDTSADSYDQVIENEQHKGLKPLELALFVQKRIALGDKQAEIARRLGKSRQWVTLATALIEPPDWLLQAYREGRCRGLNELHDLRRLHGEHGDDIEAWAARQPAITRDRLSELRARLERLATAVPPPAADSVQPSIREDATGQEAAAGAPAQPESQGQMGRAPDGVKRPTSTETPARSDQRVHVEFEGHDCQLVVSVVPDQAGCMYVRPLAGGPRKLAPVASLKLLGFVGR